MSYLPSMKKREPTSVGSPSPHSRNAAHRRGRRTTGRTVGQTFAGMPS